MVNDKQIEQMRRDVARADPIIEDIADDIVALQKLGRPTDEIEEKLEKIIKERDIWVDIIESHQSRDIEEEEE